MAFTAVFEKSCSPQVCNCVELGLTTACVKTILSRDCVFVRGCCCLMPLKEINERTTNRVGGQRQRDEREAAREGADGKEGYSDGR